jgi:iron-sulfur cluster repair protein YtfE (RIC family)
MSRYHLLNYSQIEPVEMCRLIQEHYHYKIKNSSNYILSHLDAWMKEYNLRFQESDSLKFQIVKTLQNIEDHLRKKETIFFPFVEVISHWNNGNDQKPSLVKNPILKMTTEQKDIAKNIYEIRAKTNKNDMSFCYSIICKMCLNEMLELEQTLNELFHIEQTILFQKLIAEHEIIN